MAIKFVYLIPLLFSIIASEKEDPDVFTFSQVVDFISDMKQFTSESTNIKCLLAVQPPKSMNVTEDVYTLDSAIENEAIDDIIKIISHRNILQRLKIAIEYEEIFKKSLVYNIVNLSNDRDFMKLVSGLFSLPWHYHAKELHDAIYGWGTDEDALIETLVPLSNSAAKKISDYYQRKYEASLVDDIEGDTTDKFERLLVSLSKGERNGNHSDLNNEAAVETARKLADSPYPKLEMFNNLMGTGSFPQLKKIFVQYKKISGDDIESLIVLMTINFLDLMNAYMAIVQFTKNEPGYFAGLIKKSFINENNDHLIRVLVGRSDIDLGNIKQAYEDNYGVSIAEKLKQLELGIHMRKLVLALFGY